MLSTLYCMNYRKGYYYEKKTVSELRKRGAIFTVESRGSHGVVDIVAVYSDGSIELIQVKSGKKMNISIKERKELATLVALNPYIRIAIWYWKKYQQTPTVYYVDKAGRLYHQN